MARRVKYCPGSKTKSSAKAAGMSKLSSTELAVSLRTALMVKS